MFNSINWVDGNNNIADHYVVEIVFKNNNKGYFKNKDYKEISKIFDWIFNEPSVAYATIYDPQNKVIASRIRQAA